LLFDAPASLDSAAAEPGAACSAPVSLAWLPRFPRLLPVAFPGLLISALPAGGLSAPVAVVLVPLALVSPLVAERGDSVAAGEAVMAGVVVAAGEPVARLEAAAVPVAVGFAVAAGDAVIVAVGLAVALAVGDAVPVGDGVIRGEPVAVAPACPETPTFVWPETPVCAL
jgi:hypothetical protein